MGTKRKPSLNEAGKYLYEFMWRNASVSMKESKVDWKDLGEHGKRIYTKHALEIWREVEKCL